MIARAAVLCAALAASSLAACVNLVQSTSTGRFGLTGVTCRTALGSYSLPKSVVTVSARAEDGAIKFADEVFQPRTIADPNFSYCLDHLVSPATEDMLVVTRKPNGLLTSVTSKSVDRTPEIAAKLIDTAGNAALAAARAGSIGGTPSKFDAEVDLLDPQDLVTVNDGLRPFGLCIYVEGRPLAGYSSAQWCDLRRKPRIHDAVFEAAQAPPAIESARQEILYRARQTYTVNVMRKRDPFGPGRWELLLTRAMDMPNLSPIFGIGVERTLFATRSTTLAFDDGVLTDVTIDKGSELLGFVSIPLYLSQTIVDLPARVLQLRINDTNQRSELIVAQRELIQTWKEYYATRFPAAAADAAARSGSLPASFEACIDANLPDDQCAPLRSARVAR